MQLSGISIFLLILLLQNDNGVWTSLNTHLDEELHDFQESLIKHIYDGTHFDVKDDNEKIEIIAKAILNEADRRLKKRDQAKNHKYRHKVEKEDDDHVEFDDDVQDEASQIEGRVYKNIKKLQDIFSKKARIKEELDGDEDENDEEDGSMEGQNKRSDFLVNEHKKEIDDGDVNIIDSRSKKAIGEDVVADITSDIRGQYEDKGDNNQIASVQVDNAPDLQAQLVSAKHLFLEPNANVSYAENRSSYAHHHRLNLVPPKKVITTNKIDRTGLDKFSFIAIVAACCVAGIAGIGLASYCWYKLRSETKDIKNGSSDFKSSSLRNSGFGKNTNDEVKLARGAEVFHYLHAKKQIQQMEEPNLKSSDRSLNINESTDEEEEEEDTVYECPGLAPPGEMKVMNPLFSDGENHYSDTASVQSTPTPPLEEK